jgi:hypothetical protein
VKEYQKRLAKDQRFQAIRRASTQKWRQLALDKDFVLETAALKLLLKLAYQKHPTVIRSFFKPRFQPSVRRARKIQPQINRVSDPELRNVLQRYVKYVLRFGVVMDLAEAPPHFRTVGMPADPATKFHVQVRRGRFRPAMRSLGYGDEEVSDFFPSEKLDIGPRMQALIHAGKGICVRIDDDQTLSVLTQLVDFAYFPDRITFVEFNGKTKCVMCLIGENISVDKTWHEASGVVSEFQKSFYGRVKSGRPVHWKKLRTRIQQLIRTNRSLTELAVHFAKGNEAKDVFSMLSSLSQLKRRLQL